MNGAKSLASGIAASIPWCCVLPALLSIAGLGGAAAARWTAWSLNPALFGVSLLLVGRAFYLIYGLGRGNRMSRYSAWGAAALIAAMWLPRAWWVIVR